MTRIENVIDLPEPIAVPESLDTWTPLQAALARVEGTLKYILALRIVEAVDARLEAGYHYRDSSGRLLLTLEEVVRAMLSDTLAPILREDWHEA